MANQITINIGAAANDGTGDPLRTAFNDVNLNFANVWSTGLPNSNIQFSDNRILTVNTNANLVLAPNGIGKVASNVDIVPNTNNAFNLGSPTRYWNMVYSQYLTVGSDFTLNGDLSVGGNLTVTGNIIEMGNIVTDAKTIQLANTANTASAANGAGITVGANDAIATMLYNSASNIWALNIGVKTGNIIIQGDDIFDLAGPRISNGDLSHGSTSGLDIVANGDTNATVLYNTYGNVQIYASDTGANVYNYEFGADGNVSFPGDFAATGNVQGYYFIGNGSQLTGLSTNSISNGNSNVKIATANGNVAITTNGSETWNFDTAGNLTLPGGSKLSPQGGNMDLIAGPGGWAELQSNNANSYIWVDDNGAYVGTDWLGNAYQWTFSNTGNLTTSGNLKLVTNDNLWNFDTSGVLTFPGDTLQIGLISGNTGLKAPGADIKIDTTGAGDSVWIFGLDANLTLPTNGNINVDAGSIVQAQNKNLKIVAQDQADDGWAVQLEVTDGTNLHSRISQLRDRVEIGLGLTAGPAKSWTFYDSGVLLLPPGGNIWTDASGNTSIIARSVTNSSYVELMTQDNSDIKRSNIKVTRDNITVTTSSGGYNWTFGVDGNLTVPGNTNVITANATGGAGGNSISIIAGAADQTDYYTTAGGNVNIVGGLGAFNDGGGGGPGGDVNLTAGLSADPAGHAGNINITAGSNTWVFDYNGQIDLPGGTAYIAGAANSITMYSDTAEFNGMLLYGTGVDIYAIDQVAIFANNAGSSRETRFLADGNISIQGTIYPAYGYTPDLGNSTNSFRDAYFTGNISAGNFVGGGSNVDIVAGAYDWTFGNNSYLTLPANGDFAHIQTGNNKSLTIETPGTTLQRIQITPTDGVKIYANNDAHLWQFDNTGNLTLPGNISGNVAGFSIGYRDVPQVSFGANATAALTDAGKHYYSTTAGNLALTLPDNSSVAFPTGATLTVVVNAAGNVLVNQGTGVTLYMAGSSTTGNRAVGAYGLASVMKVAANTWVISGTGVY